MIRRRADVTPEFCRRLDKVCHDVREHYGATAASIAVIHEGVFNHLSAVGTSLLEDFPAIETPALAADMARDLPTIIGDLREDSRFSECQFVVGPPYSRFYAAQPVKDASGKRFAVLAFARNVPDFGFKLGDAAFLSESGQLIEAHLVGNLSLVKQPMSQVVDDGQGLQLYQNRQATAGGSTVNSD